MLAAGAYLLPIRGGALPAGAPALPTLPDSTKLLNTTLALLSHALFATGIPAALLLVPGARERWPWQGCRGRVLLARFGFGLGQLCCRGHGGTGF